MTDALDYYAQHGAALFPIPAGSKAPGSADFWAMPDNTGIMRAGSFKKHWSRDPKQWAIWREQNPGCNFGVVAFASYWIITDTDIKPTDGQSKEDARAEAWSIRSELLASWGMDAATLPHVESARGGWHDYFVLPPHVDPTTLRQPDAIKKRINVRVIGYTVAAGSYYDGTAKGEESGWYQLFANTAPHPAPQALIDHCAPPKPREGTLSVGTHDFFDTKAFYQWMADNGTIQSDEDWRNAGMAAKLEFGDAGIELWQTLATRSGALDDQSMTRWRSFDSEPNANSVTIKTLMKAAHDAGWTGTIRPSLATMFGGVAQMTPAPGSAPLGMPASPSASGGTIKKHLKRSGDFVRGFVPPDYLIDGMLQRRFCYSLTAQTGVGKTTVAMLIAAHVAIGKKLGSLEVEKGTVLYFAGENPTDVQMRWLGLCQEMGLDPETVDVIFIEGTKRFSETAQEITQEIVDDGVTLSLVVVDTVAAFFEGDNDNDNVQMGNHARMLRSLTLLPGGPCVLTLAHPTKNATDDNLVPRGGGAFLNEVDGNIALRRTDDTVTGAALGKFRGPEFQPINFALKVVRNHPLLKDTRGRQIPTIIAEPIDVAQVEHIQKLAQGTETNIIKALCEQPGANQTDLAKALSISKSTVSRAMPDLIKRGLVTEALGTYEATPKAQKAMNALERAKMTPAEQYQAPPAANLNGAAFPIPSSREGPPMPPPF